MSLYKKVIIFILLLGIKFANAQTIASGVPYQTVVRTANGNPIVNQAVNIRFSIYSGSASGLLQWEETALSTTDNKGLVKLTIGKGLSTGNGLLPSFSSINWGGSSYYLKVGVDLTGGTVFKDMGAAQLFSVPYALYAASSDKFTNYRLNDLLDVIAVSPNVGMVVKWNGNSWISSNDNYSDSVSYASGALYAKTTDTANYGYSSVSSLDSVLFAFRSDTVIVAQTTLFADSASSSVYADTVNYALQSAPTIWKTDGNTIGSTDKFLGTKDNQDIVFKTNNSEVLRISKAGNFIVGSASETTPNFSLTGNDGILSTGTFGVGTVATSGAGAKMYWYPAKAAFRAGAVTASQWDDANIGAYSFASGYNCVASGLYSVASGNNCVASGEGTVAMGKNSQATAWGAVPSLGVSLALGDSSYATTPRSIAIGRGNFSITNNATFTVGSYNLASGAVSTALGFHSTASGHYSFVMGYYGSANSKTGSFVYADASSSTVTNSTVNNQFLVRASGGVVFYSDSARTMGVSLPAGGGSWANISDKNKKENFQFINGEEILTKVEELEIKTWNYKSQSSSIVHIGPMAQDFYKLFKLGNDSKTIATTDMDGVTLLGIKALNRRYQLLKPLYGVEELTSKVDNLSNFGELNSRLDRIEKQLAEIKK